MQRIALFLFIGLLACETPDGPKPNLDKEYFPLQVGNFQIFHVEGVEYVLRQPYPFEYELKSIVSDSFHVGDIVRYVIHRSKREPGASTWEYFETFSAEVNSREVVEYDGNTAFLRIKLPLFDSTRWDANIYNTPGTEEHILSNIGDPFDTFPDCITVGHDYDDRLILLSQLNEIYARGVGLVYKFVRIEKLLFRCRRVCRWRSVDRIGG